MQEEALDGGGSNLDGALKTLHEAEGTVKEIVAKRFDEAVKLEDLASIERFFKIFPLINMHDEGLKKFTQYLCTKVRFVAGDLLALFTRFFNTIILYFCSWKRQPKITSAKLWRPHRATLVPMSYLRTHLRYCLKALPGPLRSISH